MSSLLLTLWLCAAPSTPKHPEPETPEIGPAKNEAPKSESAKSESAKSESAKNEATKKEPAASALADAGVVAAIAKEKEGKVAKPEEAPSVPPALTAAALSDELRQAGVQRKVARTKLEEERKALGEERAKLEATALEIAKAREHLKEETARLEALLGQTGGATRSSSTPAPPGASNNLTALAKAAKAMKAPQAGAMLGHMETRLAAQVLQRMGAKDSGAILATMKPQQAAELMGILAVLPAADPRTLGKKP